MFFLSEIEQYSLAQLMISHDTQMCRSTPGKASSIYFSSYMGCVSLQFLLAGQRGLLASAGHQS